MPKTQITENLYSYLIKKGIRESSVAADLRAETTKLPEARMQIAQEQGGLIELLVRLMKAERCIEVGTFTGYSSLCVATALPEHGKLICLDISREYTDVAKRYWKKAGVESKIELRIGPAIDGLRSLLSSGRIFDFAFVDADKENYIEYYKLLKQLIRPGGIIAIDNTLWGGKVIDEKANDADTRSIRELNDLIHSDPEVHMTMVPVGDGMTLALIR